MVLVCWVTWGYRMAFGEHMIPGLVGKPGPVMSSTTELSQVRRIANVFVRKSCFKDANVECEQSYIVEAKASSAFPKSTMVYFQFVFAAITLILMAGAFLCRMNFRAWMVFVPLWLTFSYTIGKTGRTLAHLRPANISIQVPSLFGEVVFSGSVA
jgi:Amt family ammonium transporter